MDLIQVGYQVFLFGNPPHFRAHYTQRQTSMLFFGLNEKDSQSVFCSSFLTVIVNNDNVDDFVLYFDRISRWKDHWWI